MQRKEKNKRYILLLVSSVPGLGHLILGQLRSGFHLLVFTIGMTAVVICRWEIFINSLLSPNIGNLTASVFIVVSIISCIIFSILNVHFILKRSIKKKTGISPMKLAFRRFKVNQLAMIATYVIIIFFMMAILAPILAPYDPVLIDDVMQTRFIAPCFDHPFGTDEFGRDLLSRALYGSRISLSIGLLAVLIAVSFGTIYGAVAGFFKGLIDNLLMRIVDVIIAFPIFFLMLMMVAIFEVNILVMILIMGFTSWMGTARYIRGEILSLREKEFIEGAKAIGLPNHLIIFRYLIPNAMSPVLVSAALMVGGMIGAEAGLSFLGIGIQPPTPTWGNMISSGQDVLMVAWWVSFFPGLLLTITILCFNLIADGLRDALDPKTLMRKYF